MTLGLAAAALTVLAAGALPSQAPQPPAQTQTAEDTVAQSFEAARGDAHLARLTRIPDRPLLRQIVCTAAATRSTTQKILSRESQADSVIFPWHLGDPLPAEFTRVAQYDDLSSARGRRISRYAVAVFTAPERPGLLWVGVGLYWSRPIEFVALRLTHTYDPAPLRYNIVPACASIR